MKETSNLGITYNFFFLSVCTYFSLIWTALCIHQLTLERAGWLGMTLFLVWNFATQLKAAWKGNAI